MFDALAPLRSRPIPDLAEARRAKENYRETPIAACAEGREALQNAKDAGLFAVNHYANPYNPPYWTRVAGAVEGVWLRSGVLARLCSVEARLNAEGLRLHLFDGWRPRAVQAFFHEVWTPRELQRRRPDLTGAALAAEVARYWAAPSDGPDFPAPHATGAAVDVTIRIIDGDPLWMGSMFDDASPLAHPDRYERALGPDASFSDEEARANRRLLHWLMREAGFAFHPDEWWHFSYGDQMWARQTGAPAALYGLVHFDDALAEPPE